MQPKDRPFPKYARDFFEQLRGQYELLMEETKQTPPPSIVKLMNDARAKQPPDSVSWADVFTLESAYLFAIADSGDIDRLRSEVIYARNRFRDIVGVSEYAAYEKTVEDDVTKMTFAQLRAELLTLAERIRYLYTFVPPKESVRNKMAIDAAWWTLGAALLGIAIYGFTEWRLHTTLVTILVVLFVGEMGGFLSVQQRLQKSVGMDPLFKELQLSNGWFSVVVIAPISGGLFAIVLYFIFVGGLMTGGLFPRFGPVSPPTTAPAAAPSAAPAPAPGTTAAPQAAPTPCPATAACSPLTITQFFVRAEPTSIEDWGKLLVWAFIAGFAERFVPDVLSRLTGAQYSVGGDKPSGGTTVAGGAVPPTRGPTPPGGGVPIPEVPKPEGDGIPKPEGDGEPKPPGGEPPAREGGGSETSPA